jgi:hypothetical protein
MKKLYRCDILVAVSLSTYLPRESEIEGKYNGVLYGGTKKVGKWEWKTEYQWKMGGGV